MFHKFLEIPIHTFLKVNVFDRTADALSFHIKRKIEINK